MLMEQLRAALATEWGSDAATMFDGVFNIMKKKPRSTAVEDRGDSKRRRVALTEDEEYAEAERTRKQCQERCDMYANLVKVQEELLAKMRESRRRSATAAAEMLSRAVAHPAGVGSSSSSSSAASASSGAGARAEKAAATATAAVARVDEAAATAAAVEAAATAAAAATRVTAPTKKNQLMLANGKF